MKPKNKIDITLIFDNRNFKAPELAKTILANNLENELLVLSLDNNSILSNRAMWVLNHCADLDFERVKPFHVKLINHLKNKNLYSGVIRSILRMFRKHPVPKKLESFMLDACFGYIKNPAEAIAVRIYAMTIIFNISKPYPELLNELLIVLNHLNLTEESAAIRSRAKNTVKEINKIIKNSLN